MNSILVLRQAACAALSRIDDPDIRGAIASLIARCNEALEKVTCQETVGGSA